MAVERKTAGCDRDQSLGRPGGTRGVQLVAQRRDDPRHFRPFHRQPVPPRRGFRHREHIGRIVADKGQHQRLVRMQQRLHGRHRQGPRQRAEFGIVRQHPRIDPRQLLLQRIALTGQRHGIGTGQGQAVLDRVQRIGDALPVAHQRRQTAAPRRGPHPDLHQRVARLRRHRPLRHPERLIQIRPRRRRIGPCGGGHQDRQDKGRQTCAHRRSMSRPVRQLK